MFEYESPGWKNEGVAPRDELKESGFAAGYKPPASYFNWFFTRVSRCIAELQQKVGQDRKVGTRPLWKGEAVAGQTIPFTEDISGHDLFYFRVSSGRALAMRWTENVNSSPRGGGFMAGGTGQLAVSGSFVAGGGLTLSVAQTLVHTAGGTHTAASNATILEFGVFVAREVD